MYLIILIKDGVDALWPGEHLAVETQVLVREQVHVQQVLHAVVGLLQTNTQPTM